MEQAACRKGRQSFFIGNQNGANPCWRTNPTLQMPWRLRGRKNALRNGARTDQMEEGIYMKGVDVSYAYEDRTAFRTEGV